MHTLIIAEAGVNHNGNIELAKKLIDVAAEAGVDYVKFQTFKADKLVSKEAKKAEYQVQNTNESSVSQYDMLKKLELDENAHHELKSYCTLKKVKFLSTGFDSESIDLLNKIGIELYKIPSGEITNLPYLKQIGGFKKKIILSTGMCTLQEIGDALDILISAGAQLENIAVLHCNTEYPTPMEDVNLLAMETIRKAFNVEVGYSDHTLGIEIPIAAVALGATIIEKHFTLDRTLEGPDHKASLEPSELLAMVRSIRNIEKALGNGVKSPSGSEIKNIPIARKSVHLANSIQEGNSIQESDLIMKRPGDGISPMKVNELIGRKTKRKLEDGHKLSFDDLH